MKTMKLLLVAGGILCAIPTFSQRNCGTSHHHEQQLLQNPDLYNKREQIEQFTQQIISSGAINQQKSLINIPVVIHVVYNTTTQNISTAQIQSQIDILNKDFRKLNSDVGLTPSTFATSVADCEINFCLASVDPNGNATTGIVRKSTTVTQFIDDDKVMYSSQGGDDAWPASKYLNIWVCNLGNDLLGYAQLPGGPSASDGVVLKYTAFGNTGTAQAPFNKGRTATHEVGHWLNLQHIGGDALGGCGNDYVSDTPAQKGGLSSDGTGNDYGQNYGSPTHPLVRSGECSGTTAEMFMNYMDYTDDASMYMFTNGQKSRMQALFVTGGFRAGIVSSTGCGGTVTPSYCSSGSTTTQYEWISNVNLGSINNTTTGSGSYADYTSLSTNLTKGTAYNIKLTPGYSGSLYNEYFNVYIDYNNDKDFADAGETVYSSPATTAMITGTFTVPTTASTAAVRMRIIMSDSPITSSCDSYSYGETEDYTVNLISATSCNAPATLSASSVTSSGAVLSWGSVTGATGYTVQYKKTSVTTWTSVNVSANSCTLSGLTAGTAYNWQVSTVCSGGNSAYTVGTNFTTTTTCSDAYESNNSLSAAKAIGANSTITALIGTSTDIDWFKITNTSTARNIKITLTNLPADYDVRLYNSSGTLLKSSLNRGTTNESLIYNTSTVATYYIRVSGYNAAYSSSCYTLTSMISSTALRTDGSAAEEPTIQASEEIVIYPNPTKNGTFNLTFENEYTGKVNVQLMDAAGRIIQYHEFDKNESMLKENIQIESSSKGIYFVHVEGDGFTFVRKISYID